MTGGLSRCSYQSTGFRPCGARLLLLLDGAYICPRPPDLVSRILVTSSQSSPALLPWALSRRISTGSRIPGLRSTNNHTSPTPRPLPDATFAPEQPDFLDSLHLSPNSNNLPSALSSSPFHILAAMAPSREFGFRPSSPYVDPTVKGPKSQILSNGHPNLRKSTLNCHLSAKSIRFSSPCQSN